MDKKPPPQKYKVVDRDEGVDWMANLLGTLFTVFWFVVILIVTGLRDLVCWAYKRLGKE